MTRQTHPRVMILMTLTHLRTVIIDVDDTYVRNIGKGPNSFMRKFNGKIADNSI